MGCVYSAPECDARAGSTLRADHQASIDKIRRFVEAVVCDATRAKRDKLEALRSALEALYAMKNDAPKIFFDFDEDLQDRYRALLDLVRKHVARLSAYKVVRNPDKSVCMAEAIVA